MVYFYNVRLIKSGKGEAVNLATKFKAYYIGNDEIMA